MLGVVVPLWPTMATGPGTSSCTRSSGRVSRRARAERLPRQLGPEMARPVSSMAVRNSASSARPASVPDSEKPVAYRVALRVPMAAASRRMPGTLAAARITTRWSGTDGRERRSGKHSTPTCARGSGSPGTPARRSRSAPGWRRCAPSIRSDSPVRPGWPRSLGSAVSRPCRCSFRCP